jgi:hypothetical protein
MLTSVLLLAALLSAADTPVRQHDREVLMDFGGGASFVFVLPAKDAQEHRVTVAPGLRIAVPPLGQAGPTDKQIQLFAFYAGLLRR